MRLIHLSDIHQQLDWRRRSLWSTGWRGAPGRFELHALGRLTQFDDAEARLGQLLDDLHALSPDHVVLSGDLTALGHDDEFGRTRELLAPLIRERRLTVIPGNHDRYTDHGRSRFEAHFGDALKSDLPELADERGYPFVRLLGDDAALVGLDSTRVGGWTHYVLGRVGDAQLEALGQILDHPTMAERTVLLVLHHGPLGPGGQPDWREAGLLDAKKLMRVIHGRSVVLQHGHSHHRFWHRAEGARPHIFGGGSSTQPGREGYWVIDVDDHRELEGRAYLPGRQPVD